MSVRYTVDLVDEAPMMTIVAEKGGKAERIEIRVTPNVKALLSAAAQARHTTVSEFRSQSV